MTTGTVDLTRDEIVQRGKEIYYSDIASVVEADNYGRVVAIDVCTGEYELGDDAIKSAAQLRARLPDAVIFFMRVGYPTMARVL
ncbi:MAG: hypothetical protein JNM09_19280 [Blastocatellia bacterium]|nr:hypothetical protein [Blastocatellia bacterium]